MPVAPGVRDSSSPALRWKAALGVLIAMLWLAVSALAQVQSSTAAAPATPVTTNQPDTSTPVTANQPDTSTPEKPDPSARPIAPPGTIPTAAQVQAAATADAPAAPPEQKSVATAPVQKDGVNAHDSNLPPKYNVSLIGQRNVGSGLDFYSLEREMALGRSLASEVESSAKLVTDPVITEYVNRIGQNLVRNSDARVPFTIKVLENDEVNAFALPGGFFYVDSGLILAADNEAELAGVMAHEIAHVAARHATKNMTRAQIWNFASVPLMFVGGPVAYAIAEAAGLAVPLGFLKFSRDAEREADLLGLQYDYASGYDPEAFVEFFEKLNVEKKKPNFIAKAFTTHPMNVERIKDAQNEIRKYLPDRSEYVLDTSEFENVKARLEMLENSRRLGGAKGEPGRPVLLKRASSTIDSGSSNTKQASNGTPADNGRPTLQRKTSSDGDDNSAGSSANGNTGNSTASSTPSSAPADDGRPVLKRNTPDDTQTNTSSQGSGDATQAQTTKPPDATSQMVTQNPPAGTN